MYVILTLQWILQLNKCHISEVLQLQTGTAVKIQHHSDMVHLHVFSGFLRHDVLVCVWWEAVEEVGRGGHAERGKWTRGHFTLLVASELK